MTLPRIFHFINYEKKYATFLLRFSIYTGGVMSLLYPDINFPFASNNGRNLQGSSNSGDLPKSPQMKGRLFLQRVCSFLDFFAIFPPWFMQCGRTLISILLTCTKAIILLCGLTSGFLYQGFNRGVGRILFSIFTNLSNILWVVKILPIDTNHQNILLGKLQ